MNRDEERTRPDEKPPALRHCEQTEVSWIAPLDGKRGGTWIGGSSRGMMACLLNAYDYPPTAPGPSPVKLSRGALIPWLLRHRTLDEALNWAVLHAHPDKYLPFILLVADRERTFLLSARGFGTLHVQPLAEEWTMITSTSWNAAQVVPWRKEQFEKWRTNGTSFEGQLPSFHLLSPRGREEWAPLLSRENTSTRSITQIELADPHMLETRYWPRPGNVYKEPELTLRLAVEEP